MWEYKTMSAGSPLDTYILDCEGKVGWECFSVVHTIKDGYTYHFKRFIK